MYIAFPADEKAKARLDAVCKSLGITYEEWFETAFIESEYDVLTNFLSSNSESDWTWDANLCRFVRSSDDEIEKSSFSTVFPQSCFISTLPIRVSTSAGSTKRSVEGL